MMKTVVIGAGGQLGSAICNAFGDGFETIGLTHREIEITDYSETGKLLRDISPDLIINTAAFHNTEECENKPEIAFRVNAFAEENLARVSEGLSAVLVYISTDYVFDGKKNTPYTEDDPPSPINLYGASKLAGEFLTRYCSRYYIVRTASLFGKGRENFVERIIEKANRGEDIKVVNDIVVSPTYTEDVAERVRKIVEVSAPYGVYHITNSGYVSWYDFARKVFEYSGISREIVPVSSEELPSGLTRPRFSALSSINMRKLGLPSLRSWEEALKDYLKKRKDCL